MGRSAILARAIASPSRVDAKAIDHIETILQHCQRQEDSLGPQAVLDTVLAQRQLVRTLLTGCPALLRPRLLSVHSNMSSSAGHYFFELNDDASALHYCDQARATAHEAGNTELAVYALCNMSYFSSWYGRAHAGLDFAAAAQSLAGKTDDVAIKIYVDVCSGTAYAVDDQYKECMAAFDRAQAGLPSATGQMSPESPAYWCHEGLVASHQSDCLLRLRKPQETPWLSRRWTTNWRRWDSGPPVSSQLYRQAANPAQGRTRPRCGSRTQRQSCRTALLLSSGATAQAGLGVTAPRLRERVAGCPMSRLSHEPPRGLLLLRAGGAAAATQRHTGLGEHPVHEAVRPSGRLRERPDAGALLVLLLQLRCELVPGNASDPAALLQVGHRETPSFPR